MALSKTDIPDELLENYNNEKCGFYIGAGLSQGAGYKDWKGLLYDLIDHVLARKPAFSSRADECRTLLSNASKYLMVAEEIREVLGPVAFKEFIEKEFASAEKDPTEAHLKLVKLEKLKFVITTNYDMLIEDAYVKEGQRPRAFKYYESQSVQRALFNRQTFLLKAHGDAETGPDKIILTEKDYRNILYNEPGYRSVLSTMFSIYSVVFLGSSLEDPELKILLQYINAAFPVGAIQHYALMSSEVSTDLERERWSKDYNIQFIPISSEDNYKDITTFLDILSDA